MLEGDYLEGLAASAGVSGPAGRAKRDVGHGVGGAHLLEHVLGLSSRSISVAGVVDHVLFSDLLRFVDKRPLLCVAERLPLGAKPLAQLRIVHARILLSELLSALLGPDHEGVHGPLDVVGRTVGHDRHCNVCFGVLKIQSAKKEEEKEVNNLRRFYDGCTPSGS